ncbi:MAG: hypothetical protein WCV67_01555 [Victivallaceae bacterium]
MKVRKNNYTILELLFVISCIIIILNMLMPAFNESREKSRFVRWIGFNRQCSADPSCVINFNFQEGQGSILTNSAAGHENKKFNVKDYYGIVKNGTSVDQKDGSWKTIDGKWVKGRWWRGKRALQFNGLDTMVEIPKSEAIDFGEQDDFTIIVWLKFDKFTNWSTPFSKSYSPDFAQYDLYLDNTSYSTSTVKAQFEVDVCRTCVGYDNVLIKSDGTTMPNVELDTEHWYMLALRNRAAKTPQSASANNINDHAVDVLWNGQNMTVGRGTNNVIASGTRCGAKLILGVMRFTTGLSEGEGRLDFINTGFTGKIDEFIVYNRALSDNELRGHYAMGAEHL